MEKKTIEQLKLDVTNAFPSLFSKEDVLAILNAVQEPEPQPVQQSLLINQLIDALPEFIMDAIVNQEDSIELNISNERFDITYGNQIEIKDYDTAYDMVWYKENVANSVLDDIRQWVKDNAQEDAQANNI
jgi:flagellar biosynthesis component FlhA